MGDHPLQQGTKRVSVFTGSTASEGGTQVSDSNPFPVQIFDSSGNPVLLGTDFEEFLGSAGSLGGNNQTNNVFTLTYAGTVNITSVKLDGLDLVFSTMWTKVDSTRKITILLPVGSGQKILVRYKYG